MKCNIGNNTALWVVKMDDELEERFATLLLKMIPNAWTMLDREDWSTTKIGAEEPEFLAPIQNLTVPVGREAVFSCTLHLTGDQGNQYTLADKYAGCFPFDTSNMYLNAIEINAIYISRDQAISTSIFPLISVPYFPGNDAIKSIRNGTSLERDLS
ncbi:hypothetical protein Trydic_g6182 [Trypoxylus dichotomus]